MTNAEIHQHIRPFKVAIKALLKVHLPPLVKLSKRVAQEKDGIVLTGTQPQAGKVLGILFSNQTVLPHDKIIDHILANHRVYEGLGKSKDLAAIRAAVILHSKMESTSVWLRNHPNPSRIPMVNGDSTTAALPEDLEINELLQEAKTLSMVYDKDFILLLKPEVSD